MTFAENTTGFNKEDMILIFAPERCGTQALANFLVGYNRIVIHNYASDFKPAFGAMITQDETYIVHSSRMPEQELQLVITITRDQSREL